MKQVIDAVTTVIMKRSRHQHLVIYIQHAGYIVGSVACIMTEVCRKVLNSHVYKLTVAMLKLI